MKKFFLLIIMLSMSLGLLADVGNSYRYKAALKLTDNREIMGYFYFHTYEQGFNQAKTDFKTYILKYYYFPLKIYENIKTIEINQYQTVDFAIEGSGITVNKNEIVSLELIGELETEVGSRLIEVNQTEFSFINQEFVGIESFYNESYAVSCTIYLLSWSDEIDLKEIKKEISLSITRMEKEHYQRSLLQFIPKKRIELNKKKVLLFEYCGPV